MTGHDLIAIADGTAPAPPAAYGEIFAHDVDDPSRSLLYRWAVQDRWKLIVPVDPASPMELYDVIADPIEQRDAAAPLPTRVAELRKALDARWDGRS